MKGSLQVKNNIYQVVFSYKDSLGKNKTIWRSTGISASRGNKRKALDALEVLQEEMEQRPMQGDISFVEYMDRWLDSVQSEVDVVTYEGYKMYIERHIRPYFAKKSLKLNQVRLTDIEEYYKQKSVSGRLDGKPGGLSYRSIKLHGVVLSRMFNDAIRKSMIRENPCTLAKIPKAQSERTIEFYSVEQCKKLLDAISGTPLYNMVYLTFLYGLRRSEMLGLKWDAIDFNNETVSIQHTVVLQNRIVAKDRTKNQSSRRVYPMLEDVKKILTDLLRQQEENKNLFGDCYADSGYVFTREDGTPFYPSYPTHMLQKVLKRTGLPHIRWHDLRHSTASMLILKGWQMKEISEWLGHSNIGTTMNIYGHLDLQHKREIAEKLSGLLQ